MGWAGPGFEQWALQRVEGRSAAEGTGYLSAEGEGSRWQVATGLPVVAAGQGAAAEAAAPQREPRYRTPARKSSACQ